MSFVRSVCWTVLCVCVCVLQLKGAEALGKPARELAVIHVSLAATYTDLLQHSRAVEHYKRELALRQGSPSEVTLPSTARALYPTRRLQVRVCWLYQECSTWLNVAAAQEEGGCPFEEVHSSYSQASNCAQRCGQARLQVCVGGRRPRSVKRPRP